MLNVTKELQVGEVSNRMAKTVIEASGKAVPEKPLTQNTETEDEIKKAAAGKISVEDMLPRQVLADLELRVQNAINRVQNQINEALRNNNIEEVNRLRNEQALIPLRAEIDLLDAAAKAQEEYRQQQLARGASVVDIEKQIAEVVNQLNIREAELEGELRKQEEARIENLNEQKQLKAEQLQAFQTELTDLQLALDLELATTEQMREQLRLAAALAAIDRRPDLSDEQKNQLKSLETRLAQAQAGNTGVSGYMKQLKEELGDTEAMIVSLSQTIVSELSSAMSTAITGLIDGTKTAEEAFADMFKNIGKAFIDMATQMIAKALVLQALNILRPASSPIPIDFGAEAIGRASFSGGGYTGNAPRSGGIDGQGGFPAILHPQETVIDHTRGSADHRGAMNRYPSNGNHTPTFNLETTVINNVEYATVDQVRAMGKQAAREGASGGHARSMTTLKNSRSQRSKLGMR